MNVFRRSKLSPIRWLLYVLLTAAILYSLQLSVLSNFRFTITYRGAPNLVKRPLPVSQENLSAFSSLGISRKTRRAPAYLTRPLPASQETNAKKPYLDVVCVFPLMDTVEWSKVRYSHVNRTDLIKREKEYIVSLKRNLNHSAVSYVHLFSHKPEQLYKKLTELYGVDTRKVVFYNSTENPTYEEMFGYVSRFLTGRFIMILNADNYMGEGFVDLDLEYLRKNKVMYSLTRKFPVPLPPGCRLTNFSHCEKNVSYIGSHDSFMFFVRSKLPQNFTAELNFPSHVYGSENVVIWAFKNVLNFSVLNPCKILHIHHLHCTPTRSRGRSRVNRKEKNALARYTDSLYVPEMEIKPSDLKRTKKVKSRSSMPPKSNRTAPQSSSLRQPS